MLRGVWTVLLVVYILLFTNVVSAQEVRIVEPFVSEDGIWETDEIKVAFEVMPTMEVVLSARNKTDKPIKFNFDEASIITRAYWDVRDLMNGGKKVFVIPPHKQREAILAPIMPLKLGVGTGMDESLYLPYVINGVEDAITLKFILK